MKCTVCPFLASAFMAEAAWLLDGEAEPETLFEMGNTCSHETEEQS
jgi:hypothetical protein